MKPQNKEELKKELRNIFILLVGLAKNRKSERYHIWAKSPEEAQEILEPRLIKLFDTILAEKIEKIEKLTRWACFPYDGMSDEKDGNYIERDEVITILKE